MVAMGEIFDGHEYAASLTLPCFLASMPLLGGMRHSDHRGAVLNEGTAAYKAKQYARRRQVLTGGYDADQFVFLVDTHVQEKAGVATGWSLLVAGAVWRDYRLPMSLAQICRSGVSCHNVTLMPGFSPEEWPRSCVAAMVSHFTTLLTWRTFSLPNTPGGAFFQPAVVCFEYEDGWGDSLGVWHPTVGSLYVRMVSRSVKTRAD